MARGISTPSRAQSGPDSCHRMIVNDTSDTSALTAPAASVTVVAGEVGDVLLDALVRVVHGGAG